MLPLTSYSEKLGFISYEHSDLLFKQAKYFSLKRDQTRSNQLIFEAGFLTQDMEQQLNDDKFHQILQENPINKLREPFNNEAELSEPDLAENWEDYFPDGYS